MSISAYSTMVHDVTFWVIGSKIPGLISKNSIIMTWKHLSLAIFFTFTFLSLIHKILKCSQKCKILTRQNGQLTCLTNIKGKHSQTHGQKNYALSSNLENCPQLFVKLLTSLMDFRALKALLKILAWFFFTKNLNLLLFFSWGHEVRSRRDWCFLWLV